jgi:hypothetical protein
MFTRMLTHGGSGWILKANFWNNASRGAEAREIRSVRNSERRLAGTKLCESSCS